MAKKKITKKEQERLNKGEPLIHPYHKKLYKLLKSLAFEYYNGYSIVLPNVSFLAQMCDASNMEWLVKSLDALERKGKLIKFWKDGEFVVEIFPF